VLDGLKWWSEIKLLCQSEVEMLLPTVTIDRDMHFYIVTESSIDNNL
jgi:hypothetical protein